MEVVSDFAPIRENIFWTCAHLRGNNLKKKSFSSGEFTLTTTFSVTLNAEISISSDNKNLLISIQSTLRYPEGLEFDKQFISSSATCSIILNNGDLLVPIKNNISYDFEDRSILKRNGRVKWRVYAKNELTIAISDFLPDERSPAFDDLKISDLNFELEYYFNLGSPVISLNKLSDKEVALKRLKNLDLKMSIEKSEYENTGKMVKLRHKEMILLCFLLVSSLVVQT
jgi:hypothetical protein